MKLTTLIRLGKVQLHFVYNIHETYYNILYKSKINLLTLVRNLTNITMHMATSRSVAITPTKAPSNGVSCTRTAVDEAARVHKLWQTLET